MSKADYAFFITLILLLVGVLTLIILSPSPSTKFYPDSSIMCHTTDEWGLSNAKTTCYKVAPLSE